MKKIIVSFLIMACIGNTIGITANRSVQIEKEIEETERIHPSAPLATGGTALFTNSISNTLVSIEKKEIPVVTTSGENSNSCDEEHKEVEFIQYDSNQWCNIGEFNDTDYTITVTDKERVYSSRRKTSKYLIFAEDKDKNSLVFENTDCLFRGKWNSSNIQGKLKEGHAYNITVVGFRIPILSMYQNIIEVKEIQE